MKNDIQQAPRQAAEAAPNEPWQNLCYILEKFCIVNGDNREEASRTFLNQGENVDLPQFLDANGEKTPYRLFPMACYSVINSCVKLLEKNLENEVNGGIADEEQERVARGAMCLADMLFAGTCTSPDGKFSIHWVRQDKGDITLNPHGRRIKQLAARLEKYRTARMELARQKGVELDLPKLSSRATVEQDILASLAQWKVIDPKNWDGRKPWEITDSLDSLHENKGIEAVATEGNLDGLGGLGGLGGDFEERAEIYDDIIAQRAWMNIGDDAISETLLYSETQRGNILSRTPKAWLWNYTETPLQFAVDYVCTNAKPCLEEAHGLLAKSQKDPHFAEAGSLALVLDSQSKNNPDSFWKIIKRITGHFSSARGTDALLQKLDCARFTVCLEMTNRRLGIDPEEYQQIFQEKIHKVLSDPQRRETVTRNEMLLETLTESKSAAAKNWTVQDREIWLEHLQSSAVGAYENSVGMEAERKRLLTRLNMIFKTPREELERTQNSAEAREEVVQQLYGILTSATDAFYTYLSGKTGQMTRREVRTKIYALKAVAEKRNKPDLAERLGTTGRFMASISSQIKTGEWYSNKEENKRAIFNFLATMLECPKMGAVEFPGSREPEAKDPLEITCDFLRALGSKSPMGGQTIAANLEACKEYEAADEGGQLTQALEKITKSRDRGTRGETQTMTGMIAERKQTLEAAIKIAEETHGSKDPIRDLHRWLEDEAEVLRAPQTLDAAQNERFEKNLYFWKGLHYLTQNIQSRKEEDRFQVSATGKGTLQNLVAMAKAKLRNKTICRKDGDSLQQFALTKTRERSLLTNLSVPMALWLARDIKGKKTEISHEDFVRSLQNRLDACEICLQLSENDKEIDKKTSEFEAERNRAKRLTNSYIIAEVIGTLEHPEELARGLEWEMKEPKAAARLEESNPELDTPVKRWIHLQGASRQPQEKAGPAEICA